MYKVIRMLDSVIKKAFALCLLAFIASPSFADSETTNTVAEEEQQTTTVVLITDPEIQAVEDEEPDCE